MKETLCGVLLMGLLVGIIHDRGGCQRPWPWQKEVCAAREQAILNTTVRIVFHGSIRREDGYDTKEIKGTISHATVVAGRYLLTHNHFGIPLSQIQTYDRYALQSFSGVSVYRLDGSLVVNQASLDTFSVVSEAEETVLLDFGTVGEEGFFAHAGVASAVAAKASSARLTPGTEVALINWDGEGHTEVVWAPVLSVYEEQRVPIMRIDHFIEIGASGGGVFLDDQLIGNNWARVTEINFLRKKHTRVALNDWI